ncbi:MAG: tetratricopeptide repeat protein [Kiloniellaceae bacterium]
MEQPQKTTQTVSVPQAFALARRKHIDGALDEAREIYERIVRAAPDHAESLALLASIAFREGRDRDARQYLERAIDLARAAVQRQAADSAARAALVNLLLAHGRVGEAEAAIEALEIPLNPIRINPQEFGARRQAALERGLPTIVISTLPKSASESIWNKLAEGLGLAQCYLSLGLFPDCCLVPSRVAEAAKGGVVVKEHISANEHNLATLARSGIERLIVHHRDPRQATLSWAHFAREDINLRLMAPLWRKIVPPAGVLARDLGAQLDWCIENYLPRLIEFLQDWRDVADDPGRPVSVLFLSFESFRTRPEAYFTQALDFYGIPRDRFAADAEAEVVHLRKGQLDEWRSVFTEAQRRRAWELIPKDMAEAFGWER